ncbi:MAG: chromosome segregation protein SMC [Chitinophagaceae bacterium]|nr:chromosome segregation protein SMC [Oligoflexus sp.]
MHLKKLVVSGFKSFADKVTLNFDEGITGIVGPNGSGKSNVIDAVRWVMGEQNAKYLRGEVATDIIFAGSDKRKSLGMAEVTLVFDNRDDSSFCPPEYRHETEIAITRRLYIDGEREYMINKKPCRLKDIVSFFATTGLGGRSYSMIQQGQVDRILNAKPEDVREIIEEAAGTLIFKSRQQAAEKKLENTQENLKRIDDLIRELVAQLDALKEQVEKVEAWKQVSGRLREQELKLFSHNFRHFSGKLLDLAGQLDTDSDSEIRAVTDLTSMEARVEELQSSLAESDPELEQVREEISHLREQIVRAESFITNSLKTLENGQRRLFEIDVQIGEEQENLKTLETAVETKSADYDRLSSDLDRLKDLLETFQDEVDQVEEAAQVFQNRSQDIEDEVRNLEHLLESNRLRCESIERDRKRLLIEFQTYSERKGALDANAKSLEEKVADARALLNSRQEGLDSELQTKQDLELSVQRREHWFKESSKLRDQHKETFLNARARLKSFEELEFNSDDVRAGIKRLKQKHPETEGLILGTLTDFLAFDDTIKTWAPRAVQSLEKWTDRIVVAGSAELSALADLIQEEQLGSIPLSIVSLWEDANRTEVTTWAQRFGAASVLNVLKVSSDAPRWVHDLLSRLYYSTEAMVGDDELLSLPQGVVLFTAQGLLISSRDDVLIHSSASKGSLSRKSDIEALTIQLHESEALLASLQEEIDFAELEQTEENAQLRAIAERLGIQNKETLAAMGTMQQLTNQLQHMDEQRTQNDQKIQELDLRERELMRELETLGETRIQLGQDKEVQQGELEALQDEFSSIGERREEVMRVHQQRQLELAKVEMRTQGTQESLEQTQAQINRLQANLSKRLDERERITTEISGAETIQIQSSQEIEAYILRREELEEALAVRRERTSGVYEELRVVEGRLKEARDQQMEIQRQKSKKTVELERLKTVSRSLLDQAQEKHQVDLMSHPHVDDPDFDADKTNRELNKLRTSLEGMGAINMVAVEQYEKISVRNEFIQAQKEEVLGSILLLEEAIEEIQETSKDKFMTTFEVVNQNFMELFPILFPTGEARLELTSDDAMTAGVEIMVRMPGKKPRSMNLYSGGEKALTAISLIFALLKTKPTPFCFLDEVDAPLDEANVGRYNLVLDALSDRFQFIVITHNRRTMEVLDQLYGVTMQEGGVSTVVGVDMKKDLPAHLQKAFKVEGAKAAEA